MFGKIICDLFHTVCGLRFFAEFTNHVKPKTCDSNEKPNRTIGKHTLFLKSGYIINAGH